MILFFLSALSAFAAESLGPKDVVEKIFLKASTQEIASDRVKQKEVDDFVNFAELGKASLGNTKVSAKDLEWFQHTLKEIITRTVYPKAPDFLKDVSITYQKVEETGTTAVVKSTVQNKADLTDVDYKLKKTADGKWAVVDVSISGQSWVESIQDQVKDIVKKKKWKGLQESMNKRLNNLRAGKT